MARATRSAPVMCCRLRALALVVSLLHFPTTAGWMPSDQLLDRGKCGLVSCRQFGVLKSSIQVWDGVLSKDDSKTIDEWATEHNECYGDMADSFLFFRPRYGDGDVDHDSYSLTPLETLLDSILTELGDEHPIVEYWTRQEYLDLEVHSDLDEDEFEEDEVLRYPSFGHVLYLRAQNEEDPDNAVVGPVAPTCVFPTKTGGWTNEKESESEGSDAVPLVTVPVVSGRLLRFEGNAMHAVPKPLERWFLSSSEQEIAVEEEEDEEESRERSVILFNVWKDEGPRGSLFMSDADKTERINGNLGFSVDFDGINMGDADAVDETDPELTHTEVIRDVNLPTDHSDEVELISCQSQREWESVSIQDLSSKDKSRDQLTPIKIGLMGNQERRKCAKKYVSLLTEKGIVLDSLSATKSPSRIQLLPGAVVNE